MGKYALLRRHALLRRSIAVAAACAIVVAGSPSRAHDAPVVLEASVDAPAIAQTNRRLVGVGWDRAPFTAERMAPLRPDLVRVDASFERLYEQGRELDTAALDALLHEIRRVRSIGAHPVVILSYTPAWLADDRPSSDRTKVPPSDAEVWRELVLEVAEPLAREGVRWFEVWNEPDLPVFFQGLLHEFLERIYRPSAEAVREVAEKTGRRLRFGGCACFFADPAWMVPMMVFARANDLPLDFLSWHHYGNAPFLGPDGAEPLGPPEFRPFLEPVRQRNPVTSPAFYRDQVEAVRGWRDAVYADGVSPPELWIDEWNLSPGGFDVRHDTEAGAAFQTSVLIEFQRAGLDRAAMFRSVDPAYGPDVVPAQPELYGGWGLVGRYGTIKPAWRTHRFWQRLGPDVLAFGSESDARSGVWGILTRRSSRHFSALVANFQASSEHAHRLALRLDDAAPGRWSVTLRGVDGAVRRSTISSLHTLLVPVDLPPQSAVLIELRRR